MKIIIENETMRIYVFFISNGIKRTLAYYYGLYNNVCVSNSFIITHQIMFLLLYLKKMTIFLQSVLKRLMISFNLEIIKFELYILLLMICFYIQQHNCHVIFKIINFIFKINSNPNKSNIYKTQEYIVILE